MSLVAQNLNGFQGEHGALFFHGTRDFADQTKCQRAKRGESSRFHSSIYSSFYCQHSRHDLTVDGHAELGDEVPKKCG
ncbi:hypothetical protein D3C85_1296750 [compost metagenome]